MIRRNKNKVPRSPGRLRRWWGALSGADRWAVLRGMAAALLVGGIVVGGSFGLRRLQGYVMSQPAYAQNLAAVELVQPPPWMNDWLKEAISAELMGKLGGPCSTFDASLADRVRQAAQSCSWVRQIDDVVVHRVPADPKDRQYRCGVVRLTAQWRRPVAIGQYVAPDGTAYAKFIDEEGVVLPDQQVQLVLPRHQVEWPLPSICGLKQPPPGSDGQRWPGDDLKCALELRHRIESEPYYYQICQFDLSNCSDRGTVGDPIEPREPAIRLMAVSDRGQTEIRFGRLRDEWGIREPTLDRKLAHLMDRFTRNGNSLVGGRYVDLLRSGDRYYVSDN